jgi:IMP dehydrogenase
MELTYSYDDVLLQPQYSDVVSRSEVDISIDLGKNVELRTPIISAPMDTISEYQMAMIMSECGGTCVLHRYNTIVEQREQLSEFILKTRSNDLVGAAIGISGDYIDRAQKLYNSGVGFLCVDVAHGHHIMVKKAIQNLRQELGDGIHIMAGNIATLEGINDLSDWGADSVRVGVGGGSICSTRIQTGHGMQSLHTIFECAKTDRDVKIIADGGIKNSGDMVKALAAGADAVMVGSLLSGTKETPGETYNDPDGRRWKSYRGMASKEAQIEWRGKYSSFEGVATRVPYRGSAKEILEDLERGIRSGLSYSGARTVTELQTKARFIRQTSSGLSESRTHILSRKW